MLEKKRKKSPKISCTMTLSSLLLQCFRNDTIYFFLHLSEGMRVCVMYYIHITSNTYWRVLRLAQMHRTQQVLLQGVNIKSPLAFRGASMAQNSAPLTCKDAICWKAPLRTNPTQFRGPRAVTVIDVYLSSP